MPENENEIKRTVGEVIKDSQTGKLPIGSVQGILEKAPEDIKEEILEIPEWGCSVRVKSFTAAQASRIKQVGFNFVGDETAVAWAQMEKEQFREGVVEPKFSEEEVNQLHFTSGRGFNRVTKWLDEASNLDKEALKSAQEDFQKSQQPADD